MDDRIIFHEVIYSDWYAMQDDRAVVICELLTDQKFERFEPPQEWGNDWAWKSFSCIGIVFVPTAKENEDE